ncbi:AMP_1a_G0023650.mRNA.1.CDS.1 [Saccharomyces cerevisiae]|nr:AMP_1a_G0023650.mRNA.1.CDS.1 [Saccharomyces cerevisiae]CAI4506268.1 BBM_1a_G0022790.mRNA.1.CDS.1 [Saccharomyces cerevisiae]CAI6701874.1 AMP_1a_G0023650.mRNA.1.CDS.1 [Saccharomyces cerevisiae]CAI7140903.1 BBM_1a_G0022790.mRNA.1.CDS.1 [Saccharomyces cerevisiae]
MESVHSRDPVKEEKKHVFMGMEHELNPETHNDSNSDSYGLPQLSEKYNALRQNRSLIIQQTEIISSAYNKWYLQAILLLSAFICGYGYGLDGNIRYIYTGYATSSYSEHSLLSTINVINAVVSAASQIIYARLSDVFGRLYLFISAVILYVVGTIIQSQAYDVQRYAAGAIFYNAGYVGVILILLIILSDFSSLKWRLLYQFVPTWLFIINTWIAGNITSRANPVVNWSWDVDVVGVLLMGCSLGCILVPLTLAGGVKTTWNDSRLIGPFVLGFVLIPILWIWEYRFARDPILPYKLVKDRAVWSSMGISFLIDFIYYMAADYLYTVMIVAVNESVKSATRIATLSSFVSTVASPFFALLVTRCTRLKPFIMFGCALWMVAMGLLYHFRGGSQSHSGIIGALCVWGVGTTLFTYPVTVSVQSAVSHENMATVTALNYTLYRIGSAVGSAVSGAIWTQTLYKQILKRMGDVALATTAYESPYTFIETYTWGTPQRNALMNAYKYVQRLETIVALVFCVPLIAFSLCLRDPKLTDTVAVEYIEDGEYVDTKDNDPILDWFEKLPSKFTSKRE